VQVNPNKKENNPPISSEHLFFSSRFSYYPKLFILEPQSLSWTKQKNKNTPFFGFTIKKLLKKEQKF